MQPLILNVDDYDPGRYARTRVLKQAGFSVVEAATGGETVRLAAKHSPSLILLDVNLPDMSGFEVCRRIKTDPLTMATTVVHISSSSILSDHQVQGLDCGADSYLIEPIDPRVLIATVKAFLRARAAEDALRRSNEELQWFGYRVAHDLAEPLRTITSHVQVLERDLSGRLGDSAESMRFVVDATGRMRSFIDGLLHYATAASSAGPVELQNSETILKQALLNLETTIASTGAEVTYDPLPVVPTHGGLEHVFQNLISNSIKYRREGVAPKIHISATQKKGIWHFAISDNGIGIGPEDREKIFTIFRRLHDRAVPGYGIGLAIAQRIIQSHGGSIWVESEPGNGSTFMFSVGREATRVFSQPC